MYVCMHVYIYVIEHFKVGHLKSVRKILQAVKRTSTEKKLSWNGLVFFSLIKIKLFYKKLEYNLKWIETENN